MRKGIILKDDDYLERYLDKKETGDWVHFNKNEIVEILFDYDVYDDDTFYFTIKKENNQISAFKKEFVKEIIEEETIVEQSIELIL